MVYGLSALWWLLTAGLPFVCKILSLTRFAAAGEAVWREGVPSPRCWRCCLAVLACWLINPLGFLYCKWQMPVTLTSAAFFFFFFLSQEEYKKNGALTHLGEKRRSKSFEKKCLKKITGVHFNLLSVDIKCWFRDAFGTVETYSIIFILFWRGITEHISVLYSYMDFLGFFICNELRQEIWSW